MKKFNNISLMLKQGIKGVFKFKAQFIIIIILAFIATLILSVSVSTQRRLQSSYDKIVKPVDKFDYSGTIKTRSNVDSSDDPYIELNMLNSDSATSYTVSDGTKQLKQKNGFNFVLDNFDDLKSDKISSYGLPSFITEATKKFISSADLNKAFLNSDDGNRLYANILSKYLFRELKIISNFSKDKNLNGFRSMNSQTKYSAIGVYTYKNPTWFDKFVEFGSDNFPTKFNVDYTTDLNGQTLQTVLMTASSLAGFCNQAINGYNSDPVNEGHTIENNGEAIAFLFGRKAPGDFTGKDSIPEKWIVSESNPKYSLKANFEQGQKSSAILAYTADSKKGSDRIIWENGLKGITNPLINFGGNSNTDYTLVDNWNNFENMDRNARADNSLYYELDNSLEFYLADSFDMYNKLFYDGTINDDKNINNTQFRIYNQISASAAGFDFKIRREITYFDSQSQIKFRNIIINSNEDYNLTYLEGREPATFGEVALSEQFAAKNGLHVGSAISIGNIYIVVSGIATDAMSYMPAQDIQNPIPNPKKSAYVFMKLQEIQQITAAVAGTSIDSSSDQELNYYLWNTEDPETRENRFDAFNAFLSNDSSELINNQNAIKEFVETGKATGETGSHMSFKDFNHSPYRYSWTVQPTVMKIYDSIVFIAAGVIALIAIIALVVGVKKTIDFNSKQIGILKALGANPSAISISYISYSIVIGMIVVPAAWLIGLALQIPFGSLFMNYFSMLPNNFIWDWVSIVIAFAVLGVLSGAIAFVAAHILTGRPILSILTSSVKWGRIRSLDWLKNHAFKKANFSTRFSMTLTSSGSRQIILLSVVILIASFLISICLSIPAIVVKVNSSYYSSINYSNKYNEIPMIGNAPLSKNAISYWNGQEYADGQYIDGKLKLDDTDSRYGYYNNIDAYSATIANSSVISPYLYDSKNQKFSDSYLYILNHLDGLMTILGTMFGNNLYNVMGSGFSIGMVDQFYGTMLHSLDNIIGNGGVVDNSEKFDDKVKLADAQNLSSWLTTSIPKLVSIIINSSDSGSSVSGTTWKDKLLSVLYSQLPSYVKGYLQRSESRKDQYAISFQNEIFIPGEETLTTNVDSNQLTINGKKQAVTLTGLDKNQDSISISSDYLNKLYLPDDIKKQLFDRINVPVNDTDILNKDVVYDGMKLYDGSTKTLSLPIAPNKQAESAYGLSRGNSLNNWENNLQYLQFKDIAGNFINLPKNAWVYDDSDFANYLNGDQAKKLGFEGQLPYAVDPQLQYDSSDPNNYWAYDKTTDGKHYYLDPTSVNNGKLSYTKEFNSDGDTLSDRALMFKDFTYDKNGRPNGTYLRPYYQYKNFKIMVPENWLNSVDKFLWNDGYQHTNNGNKPTNGWYSEAEYKDIPTSVSDSYQRLSMNNDLDWSAVSKPDSKWLVVNPYDLNYFDNGYADKKDPLTYLTDGPGYWYRYILEGDKQLSINLNENVKDYLKSQGSAKGINIKLTSVGDIDSYNDKLIVTDSDFANSLLGYSNSRAYQYNYQMFDKSTLVKASHNKALIEQGKASQFDRWKAYTEDDITNSKFIVHNWDNNLKAEKQDVWQPSYYDISGNVLDYAPHNFYNGKLSNIDEPLNLTSAINETLPIRVGQNAIKLGHSALGYPTSSVSSSTLLSTVRALTNQIAALAISIGAMLVAAIVITAALLTMLTGDIYISQYKRFMVLLKAMGYSEMSIATYTFGTVTVMSIGAWIIGTVIAWVIIFAVVQIMWASGFAIPVGISWWPILLSLAILAIAYIGSLDVSSRKARKVNPSVILTETAE